MKYLVILCTFLFSLSANAHTIKGKITGLKDGTIVYLLTHSDDKIDHKWSLRHKVDSTIVKNGSFEFHRTQTHIWASVVVRSDKNYLKYYFNKDENITFEGWVTLFGLVNETITGGHVRILLEDIFKILMIIC